MLPDHLRGPLEQIGAEITPLPNGGTHVRVPGADREYRFLPGDHYGVSVRRAGETVRIGVEERMSDGGEWEPAWPTVLRGVPDPNPDNYGDPEAPAAAVRMMSSGRRSHAGPDHTLSVEQRAEQDPYSNDPLQWRMVYRHHLRLTAHPDTEMDLFHPLDQPTSDSPDLIRAVLQHHMPMGILMDHLAEAYGVDRTQSHEEIANDARYAREMEQKLSGGGS